MSRPKREARTERFSITVTPTVLVKLNEYADDHRWARSVAVEVLIEQGLAAYEASREASTGETRLQRPRALQLHRR
jgi:hypothetical protein